MTRTGIGDLLAGVERGEAGAWDSLMALVYQDLKRVAHIQMRRIAPGQTLTTTVLVHEAFEKLASSQNLPARDHSSFYALCARAMRQIIIDHYRRRDAAKRSPEVPELLAEQERRRVNPEADNALDALGRVLSELIKRDERMVEVFEMRHFAGLTEDQIAERMKVSKRTVQRIDARAQAWIIAALEP
jgi:RNA polymerase sigma factor (TIGR02999 family)